MQHISDSLHHLTLFISVCKLSSLSVSAEVQPDVCLLFQKTSAHLEGGTVSLQRDQFHSCTVMKLSCDLQFPVSCLASRLHIGTLSYVKRVTFCKYVWLELFLGNPFYIFLVIVMSVNLFQGSLDPTGHSKVAQGQNIKFLLL